jgi:hypothetical protein
MSDVLVDGAGNTLTNNSGDPLTTGEESLMATVTMTYSGPADGQTSLTFSHSGTIPDAVAPSFFAFYRDALGNYFDAVANAPTKEPVGPTVNGQPGQPNAVATDAQIYEAFASATASSVAAMVTRFMQDQAAAAARAQIAAAMVTKTS